MPMTHTPVESPVCTEPTAVLPIAPACAPPREPENAPRMPAICPIGRPSKPCWAAATCSVFRTSNLTTYFVVRSLPICRCLRACCGLPRLYASVNSLRSAPRFARSSTWKFAFDSSSSAKSAMLFAVNLWRKVALLLLISPGITTSAGPCLPAFVYWTSRYIVRSAASFARCEVLLPAVGEALDSAPQLGGFCALAAPARTRPDTIRLTLRTFMSHLPERNCRPPAVQGSLPAAARSLRPRLRGRSVRVPAVVAIQLRDDVVRLLVQQLERHRAHVGARVGGGVRGRVGDGLAVRRREREAHPHGDLVDAHDRVVARLRHDQTAQDEVRAEALRGRERGVRIVPEVRVDLGLRDLLADLLRRERAQPERAKPRVDHLEVRPVIVLLGDHLAVRLLLADDQHDLLVLDRLPARRREARGDPLRSRRLRGAVGVALLRELESLSGRLGHREGENGEAGGERRPPSPECERGRDLSQ